MSDFIEILPAAEIQLEFNKVRELLASHTKGEAGRQFCAAIQPETDAILISKMLDEVNTILEMTSLPSHPVLSNYNCLDEELQHLAVEGYVLAQEIIHEIGRQLEQVELLIKFFSKPDHVRDYTSIAAWVGAFQSQTKLIKRIRSILDEKGDMRPDASPELLSISRNIDTAESRLNKEFNRIMSQYRSDAMLADPPESIRSGRRVLAVLAEYKRKVRGIVHDESTTGKTVFVEPDAIVEIHNDIIELKGEYKKEVLRILRLLCEDLRPELPLLHAVYDLIVKWDITQAKALFAKQYEGKRPKVQEDPILHIIRARHPLLLIKNKSRQLPVIPFDLVLNPPNRMLILSGPNAGGKSILLKATGLLQMMVQSGMLLPVDGGTIMGTFTQVHVDIGDQQSIEDDLSTYSSRLKNMKQALSESDARTLILIDEFGSGTDPKMGGAIAEAILHGLVKKGSFGIITTHYPNIKMYAHRTKGVVNGAMLFDKEKILPTYQLRIGKPGSSFAFEIAERTGLPDDVLDYARRKVGEQNIELEDLLHDLDDKSRQASVSLDTLRTKEKELDKLIANYEQMRFDLEVKKKQFRLEQKHAALNESSHFSQEVNKLLRDLQKEKNADRAKELAKKIQENREVIKTEISNLIEEEKPVQTITEIKPGDHVKVRSTQQIGTVEKVFKDRAEIIVGQLKMTIAFRDLIKSGSPVEVKHYKSVQTQTDDYSRFENELDIRGMLPEEALRFLERFIDAAFMSKAHEIRVVHGKGTGALRNLVKKTMKGYPFKDVFHPVREAGGDGVTIGTL